MKGFKKKCAKYVAGGSALATSAVASAQVTLPPTGVDVEDYVTALVTALGTGIAAVIGAYFAYLALRKIMGWARKVG